MIEDLFSDFSDSTVYFIMGSVGTLLFAFKVAMMLIFGVDDGGDFDTGGDGDGGHGGGDAGFSLFSLLSIIAFMMGAGWFGLAARTDWQWSAPAAAASACAFGFALMLFTSAAMWKLKRFNEGGRYDITKAVGRTGRVYRTIPEKGQGQGDVEIDVDGRRNVMRAKSVGPKIESFSSVRVVEVLDDGALLVEPN